MKVINAEDHIRMVSKITGDLYKKLNFRYSYEDLFQVGCVGLMKAVRDFDEAKGYQFSTYAYRIIWGSIRRFVRDDSWYIAKKREDRFKEAYAPFSLNKLVGKEKDTPVIDLIVADISEYSNLDLKIALNKLPRFLRKIILMRYFYNFTWTEISKLESIPKSTVYRRKDKALKILREELS